MNKQLEKDIKTAGLSKRKAALVRRKYARWPAVSYLGFPEFKPDFDWRRFTPVIDMDAVYERQAE